MGGKEQRTHFYAVRENVRSYRGEGGHRNDPVAEEERAGLKRAGDRRAFAMGRTVMQWLSLCSC